MCEALGRPRRPLPDYLHVIGILHHLGIDPRLDYLEDDNRFAGCTLFDEFLAKVRGLAGELSVSDVEVLRGYFNEHRDRIGRERMRWAFISWDAGPPAERRPAGCGYFAFAFAAATSAVLLRFMSIVWARLYVWMSLKRPLLSRTAYSFVPDTLRCVVRFVAVITLQGKARRPDRSRADAALTCAADFIVPPIARGNRAACLATLRPRSEDGSPPARSPGP